MENKNKGFTMIELLAAIVILGILSTIGLASVQKIINKSKQNYYSTEQNSMIEAAQSYMTSNRNLLPKEVGQSKSVTLSDLYEAKYITDKIKDENGEECYATKSKVFIYKKTKNDYSYTGYLVCPSCKKNNTCSEYATHTNPIVNIAINDSCTAGNKKSAYATVNITASDQDKAGTYVSSYSYKIVIDGIQKYESGSQRVNGTKSKSSFTIDLSSYINETITIKVTATNSDGGTKTVSKTSGASYCADTEIPACSNVSYEKVGSVEALSEAEYQLKSCPDDKWINASVSDGTRKVWVKCDPTDGTPCKQSEVTKSFTEDGMTGEIDISDFNTTKETTKCTVLTCIDKTYPKIKVTLYKALNDSDNSYDKSSKAITSITANSNKIEKAVTGWLNNENYPYGVIMVVEGSDELSGVKGVTYKYNAAALDEATANKSGYSKTTSNYNSKSDSKDGYPKYPSSFKKVYKISAEGYRKVEFQLSDGAGNISTVDLDIKMDRTAPTGIGIKLTKYNTTQEYIIGQWNNGGVKAEAVDGKTDSISKFEHYNILYTADNGSTSEKEKVSSYVDNSEGETYVQISACDAAGNCSDYTKKSLGKILIDKTGPNCTVSGGNTKWKKGSVSVTVNCQDNTDKTKNVSGCLSTSKQITESTGTVSKYNVSSMTVTDKAGNTVHCGTNVIANFYIDNDGPTAPTKKNMPPTNNRTTSQSVPEASGSTDKTDKYNGSAGSGGITYEYCYNTTGSVSSCSWSTSIPSYTRTCGTKYYGYVRARDAVGNYSSVTTYNMTYDNADSYSAWSSCSKACGGGKHTRTNSCILQTKDLTGSCNPQSCCSSVYYVTDYNQCSGCTGNYYRTAYSSYNGTTCWNDWGGSPCTKSCVEAKYTCRSAYGNCYANVSGNTIVYIDFPRRLQGGAYGQFTYLEVQNAGDEIYVITNRTNKRGQTLYIRQKCVNPGAYCCLRSQCPG